MGTHEVNASNVSAGKPKITGAISVAPVGTTLPTSPTEELDAAFEGLGYCSDAGLTNGTNLETNNIKAWGGDTVLVIQSSKEDTYNFVLIEIKNVNVLKFVYGSANVSGDLENGITIIANNKDVDQVSIVIDMILSGNTLKRIVIPTASVSEIGDLTYSDEDAVGYDTTVNCIPDTNGNTHYEYMIQPSTPSA